MIFPPILPEGALKGIPKPIAILLALPGAIILGVIFLVFFVLLFPIVLGAYLINHGYTKPLEEHIDKILKNTPKPTSP